jgi:hypothetical protein
MEVALRKRLCGLCVLIGVALVLTGCSSGIRLGWAGSDSIASMRARYAHWSGSKQKLISLEANDVLELTYKAKVNKGSLIIEVLPPEGDALLAVNLEQDAEQTVKLTAEEAGRYVVKVRGEGTGGSFSISWTTV